MFNRFVPFAFASALVVVAGCAADTVMPQGRASTTRAAVVDAECANSLACGKGEYCTTEDGDCEASSKCEPGAPCPAVCYGTCQPAEIIPRPCGPGGSPCGDGKYCCNPSCGICAPYDRTCDMRACGEIRHD